MNLQVQSLSPKMPRYRFVGKSILKFVPVAHKILLN
jgi:hypothetical protein